MARSATSGQVTNLTALDRQTLVRLRIEDHAATLQDYTVAGGGSTDWFISARITESVDQRAARATITLHREISGTSLAPAMNANAPIDAGRDVVLYTAVLGQADTVSGGDWVEVFRGTVDDVMWGGDDSLLVLECRDQFGRIIDAWHEAETTYGNTASPVAMETVIQTQLDDVLGSSVVTLDTPTSPSFGMLEYAQRIKGLADALGEVVDLIGWDLRYKWNAVSAAYLLTLYEPDRSKTTPDLVLDADDYYTVRDVARSTQDIRNVGIIEWEDGSFVTIEDAASIAEYGRRVIYLDATQDPQITNSTKATNLITAVVADLAQPLIAKTVEGPYDWRPELGDLVRWTANSVHASSDLDQAVVALEHYLGPDGNTTTYYTRGQPSGGNRRWHRKESKRKSADASREILEIPEEDVEARITSVTRSYDDDGKLVIGLAGSKAAAFGVCSIGLGSDPTAPAAGASTTLNGAVTAGDTDITLTSSSGFGVGNYAWITDGANSELVYVGSDLGGNVLRLRGANNSNTGLAYNHASGVTITELENTGASTSLGGGVFDLSGVVKMENTGASQAPADTVQPDMGEDVRIIARAISTFGVLGPASGVFRGRRGDTEYVPPRVTVQATRSGSDNVAVAFTVEDPSLALTGDVSYKRRDKDTQAWDGSWQTSWTSSTGTAGTNTTLTRSLTISADTYTALSWKLDYTDELGVAKTKGDDLDLSSVAKITKTITIPASAFVPEDETTTWLYLYDASEGVAVYANSVVSAARYFAAVLIPQGVTMTDMACRFYRNHADSAVGVTLREDGTALLTVSTNSTAGWHGNSGTLSQTTGAANYFLDMTIDADGGATSAGLAKVEITYSSPSFAQTY